jgi:hypothetical protein
MLIAIKPADRGNIAKALGLLLQNEQFSKTITAIKQAQSERQTFMAPGHTQAAVAGGRPGARRIGRI